MERMTCAVEGCRCKVAHRGLCYQHHRAKIRSGEISRARCKSGEPEAFVRDAFRRETDDCILWPYGVSNTYGFLLFEGVGMSAPRAMCLLAYGKPEIERPVAAHSCDVRLCINKRHLRWTTYQGNADDRLAHGVVHRGRAAGSKLTEQQVLAIYSDPRQHRAIAVEYGCGKSTVNNIKTGQMWAWLTKHERVAA
jgi:hypothetical protein